MVIESIRGRFGAFLLVVSYQSLTRYSLCKNDAVRIKIQGSKKEGMEKKKKQKRERRSGLFKPAGLYDQKKSGF